MAFYSKVSLLLIILVVVLSTIAQVYAAPTIQDSLQEAKSVTTDNFYSHHISANYNIAKYKKHSSPKIVSDHRRAKGHKFANTVVHISKRKDAQKLSKEFQDAIGNGDGWYTTTHVYSVNHFMKPDNRSGMTQINITGYGKNQKFMYLVRKGKVMHFQSNCLLVAKSQAVKDDHCTQLNNNNKQYTCKKSTTKVKGRKKIEKFKEVQYGECVKK